MVWSRTSLGFLCCLAVACGPEGVAAPETDGESEDSGSSTTGGDDDPSATNPTATNPTATNPTNSGTATTTSATTDDTTNPEDSSGDDPTDTTPTADTGECEFGTEGCLCDVGASCDEGLFCDDEGMCVAPPDCRPLDTDPHGDEDSAYELDMVGCGDGNDLGVVATLQGPERDWYRYFGGEQFMCPEQPAAAVAAAVDLNVCVFIECVEGNAVNVQCGDGANDADSPDGRPGCCGQNGAQIDDYDCQGMFAGLDTDVWIAVSSDERICEDYALSYGF